MTNEQVKEFFNDLCFKNMRRFQIIVRLTETKNEDAIAKNNAFFANKDFFEKEPTFIAINNETL